MQKGFLVLESGETFEGVWRGGEARAGEVVFNTSHSGYEEIATDPSYYSQIVVMTAPMQGNYGADRAVWESRQIWIDGFVALEVQSSLREKSWQGRLQQNKVPILTDLDTRLLVLHLRDFGTPWGALVPAEDKTAAIAKAQALIAAKKQIDSDWVYAVTRRETEFLKGLKPNGPRVGVLDFGCKENTLRELQKICSDVAVFSSRASAKTIQDWAPQGLLLSNGPGDPALVKEATLTVRSLLGWKPIFGICMGHQILAQALGAETFRLKFGHRGSNHPVRDSLLNTIYMTSQNHGYAVKDASLPSDARVTHVNLNDGTVEGIECAARKCFSVQYHPESHPGPHEARDLFDYFVGTL